MSPTSCTNNCPLMLVVRAHFIVLGLVSRHLTYCPTQPACAPHASYARALSASHPRSLIHQCACEMQRALPTQSPCACNLALPMLVLVHGFAAARQSCLAFVLAHKHAHVVATAWHKAASRTRYSALMAEGSDTKLHIEFASNNLNVVWLLACPKLFSATLELDVS